MGREKVGKKPRPSENWDHFKRYSICVIGIREKERVEQKIYIQLNNAGVGVPTPHIVENLHITFDSPKI